MSSGDVLVRLEDGKGLWRELALEGTKLTQCSQVLDGERQESSTRFESVAEAKDQFTFLLGRYLKQGFKEVSRTEGVKRAPEAIVFVEHPEYEAACVAAPDDPKPWQIYADWLQDHGDPRGELATHLLDDSDVGLVRLESQRDALLGPYSDRELHDFVIKNGFLAGATLERATPQSDTNLAALTKDFLGRPIARFVRELQFGLADWAHNDWTRTVQAVCGADQAKQLRKLEFNAFAHQTWELSRLRFGDFSSIWSSLPALEHLHLRAGWGGKLGRIEHSKLKTLIRESDGLPGEELEAILQAKLPALERLELWTGLEGEVTSDQFAEVLQGKRFPRLTHLGVISSELSVGLVRALEKSPLLPRLRVLDLSKGVFTDAEVDVLLRVAPKFAHLELNLSENFIGERLADVRRAFPRAVLKDQRPEADRYAAVGE